MAETISTNQFKNGMHVEVDGTVYRIVDFQHVKPGKGGAFVRTKLRRASDGNVIDRTFRAGEKFRSVLVEVLHPPGLGADRPELLTRPKRPVDDIAVAGPAQLGAHKRAALARLDVLEFEDLVDRALDVDVSPVAELVGADHDG